MHLLCIGDTWFFGPELKGRKEAKGIVRSGIVHLCLNSCVDRSSEVEIHLRVRSRSQSRPGVLIITSSIYSPSGPERSGVLPTPPAMLPKLELLL
jgi:hypothetical protein